ncbi:MAG: acetyl-coenzyme A synthetase, partial [Flavobacteriia bacterium]|nr:acetyl-coenzyme A synthetase [Flavobacteriia bacterium]
MPYHLKTVATYQNAYENASTHPETFWGEIAENFHWFSPWKKVMDCKMEKAEFAWFQDGKTNISYNCLDRHLTEKGAQTALIFEPNDPKEKAQHISYIELHARVSKMANVLKANGIEKGDRVCIYLPMIPELAISVLACARIGAVHSVVFAGFSATALSSRIQDCTCKLIVTADGGFRGNKEIDLKIIVDEALLSCPSITKSLVVKRTHSTI